MTLCIVIIIIKVAQVTWTRLYNTDSSMDGGTWGYSVPLKKANRRNVVTDPKRISTHVKIFLITKAHIPAAGMKRFV